MTQAQRRDVARLVAAAFLDGVWDAEAMAARAAYDLGLEPARWLAELARLTVRSFPTRPVDQPRAFERFIATESRPPEGVVVPGRALPALVTTAMGPARWPVPPLDDHTGLAAFLGLVPTELDWFADVRSLERLVEQEALRHYRYRWLARDSGAARLLEAPKDRLKRIQRRILDEILAQVPPHPAACGFRPGGSVHRFAAPHVGREVVIGLDLEGFFASVGPGRVFAVYRGAGYPEPVAHALTGLATNVAPAAILRRAPTSPAWQSDTRWRLLRRLRAPHLPQGAPTSPALANLVALGLDRRLTGLAERFGARYTRYADDLAFSGGRELAHVCGRLIRLVGEVVREEGFRLNPAKSRVMRASQRQLLGGLVVNARLNVPRHTYERLQAVLHDAALHGPAVANRAGHPDFRNHLLGRIAWVEAASPERGARLRARFSTIRWP